MGWLLCAVLQQFVILRLPILHCCWVFVRQCLNWVFFYNDNKFAQSCQTKHKEQIVQFKHYLRFCFGTMTKVFQFFL